MNIIWPLTGFDVYLLRKYGPTNPMRWVAPSAAGRQSDPRRVELPRFPHGWARGPKPYGYLRSIA